MRILEIEDCPTTLKLRRAYLPVVALQKDILVTKLIPSKKLAVPGVAPFGAKPGGERGIRTLDTPFRVYTISNRAPSTTRTSLPVRISNNKAEQIFAQPCKVLKMQLTLLQI